MADRFVVPLRGSGHIETNVVIQYITGSLNNIILNLAYRLKIENKEVTYANYKKLKYHSRQTLSSCQWWAIHNLPQAPNNFPQFNPLAQPSQTTPSPTIINLAPSIPAYPKIGFVGGGNEKIAGATVFATQQVTKSTTVAGAVGGDTHNGVTQVHAGFTQEWG